MDNRRRIFWIDPKGQGNYILRIVALEFIVASIVGLLTAFLTLFFLQKEMMISPGGYWVTVYGSLVVMCLALAAFLVWLGIRLSHRIYGPIYRFKKVFEESASRKQLPRKIVLREKDEFKQLAELMNNYFSDLKSSDEEQKMTLENISSAINEAREQSRKLDSRGEDGIAGLLDKIDHEIRSLKSQ